jgi:catechol 2,3-dioxygenase-like lactoylglutathione lyase family enzyme
MTRTQAVPKLRVARPSDDLEAVIRFYRDGLGLSVLLCFDDHDGIGHAGAPYHLEFTRTHGHVAGRAPTKDNPLVFYLPDPAEWNAANHDHFSIPHQKLQPFQVDDE